LLVLEFAMDTTETLYNEPAEEEGKPSKAGLLHRIIAKAIDFIIVGALFEIVPKLGIIAGIVYLSIADGLFEGRSPGKKLMGLRVILQAEDDRAIACGYKESILRNTPFVLGLVLYWFLGVIPLIGWLISMVILAAVIVFEILIIVGSDKGTRLGDEIGKTVVIEDKQGGVNVS